ncbi:MAG TPA: porin family protein [Flavisolibacter sp.]
MKMKLAFIPVMAILSQLTVSAQAQTQIRAGLNLANISVTDNGRVDDANQLSSFHAGILADLPLSGPVNLQTGLLFTGKGSKVQHGTENTNGYFRQTFNPYYLEIPATVVVKTPGTNNRFFVGAGPYVAIGVGGKTKTEGQNLLGLRYSSERSIEFSNDDPSTLNEEEDAGFGIVKRFDYGLNGTAGIEGKTIVLAVNYGLGLAKLQSGSNSGADNDNKHRVLGFTLGFKL